MTFDSRPQRASASQQRCQRDRLRSRRPRRATGSGANVAAATTLALSELAQAKVALGAIVVISDGAGTPGPARAARRRPPCRRPPPPPGPGVHGRTRGRRVQPGHHDRAAGRVAGTVRLQPPPPSCRASCTRSSHADPWLRPALRLAAGRRHQVRPPSPRPACPARSTSATRRRPPRRGEAPRRTQHAGLPPPAARSAPAPDFSHTTLLSPTPSFASLRVAPPAPAPAAHVVLGLVGVDADRRRYQRSADRHRPGAAPSPALQRAGQTPGRQLHPRGPRTQRSAIELQISSATTGRGCSTRHLVGAVRRRTSDRPQPAHARIDLVKRAAVDRPRARRAGDARQRLAAARAGAAAAVAVPAAHAGEARRPQAARAVHRHAAGLPAGPGQRDARRPQLRRRAGGGRRQRRRAGSLSELERAVTDEALGRPARRVAARPSAVRMQASDMDQVALIAVAQPPLGLQRRRGAGSRRRRRARPSRPAARDQGADRPGEDVELGADGAAAAAAGRHHLRLTAVRPPAAAHHDRASSCSSSAR